MNSDTILTTERLIIRQWRHSDLDAMAAINADPKVMEHFESTIDRDQTHIFIERSIARFEKFGYCFSPVEVKDTHEFIGFVGLNYVDDLKIPCAPAVEIGWRLATRFWGKGYATEAASAIINHAFSTLGLDSLVSFTAATNLRSRKVMERIGFVYDQNGDFDHPKIAIEHPLRRHVLYRLEIKMILNLTHRKAKIDDLRSIITLLLEDDLGKIRESTSLEVDQRYIDAFKKIDADTNQYLMVVEGANEIVGTCHLTIMPSLTFTGQTRVQIEAVRVTEKFRGKGIGEWMIQAAITYGKSVGATIVQLTTNKNRPRAKKFYEKLGFESSHDGMKLYTIGSKSKL